MNNNDTCTPCVDTNCSRCRINYTICEFCDRPYGVNMTTMLCILCLDSINCVDCVYDWADCRRCVSGYGVMTGGTCIPCNLSQSYCLDCHTNNILACNSCPSGRYLEDYVCNPCMSGCA